MRTYINKQMPSKNVKTTMAENKRYMLNCFIAFMLAKDEGVSQVWNRHFSYFLNNHKKLLKGGE